MLPVKIDGIDGSRSSLAIVQAVSHIGQLLSHPGGYFLIETKPARCGLVLAEGTLHLVTHDVGRLTGLLDVHAELDHVQKKLEHVLILGVSALNGKAEPAQNIVLKKGTPYPSTQVEKFKLVEPHQTEARIVVLEGDAGTPEERCVRLGEFCLKDLPPYPDLTERIEITFRLDSSGLLTAIARDLKSGVTAQMEIEYRAHQGTGEAV